jgi:hypothetical protein
MDDLLPCHKSARSKAGKLGPGTDGHTISCDFFWSTSAAPDLGSRASWRSLRVCPFLQTCYVQVANANVSSRCTFMTFAPVPPSPLSALSAS